LSKQKLSVSALEVETFPTEPVIEPMTRPIDTNDIEDTCWTGYWTVACP
jgi:hypothetical protein